ncbi:MAG: Asp-tRNA(Asn)/Glu-tRNA(Gln) amidotransferase subunit GatC [Candidatus Nealsonbacteria bacterium]|nr:Asp-tRNA(Asn)/Glu-tRNA(Gln) amidotransferase subunit GatC [Candidatus Nealsonbacteria bacterium]
MLSKKEVQHIAKLARLSLKTKDEAKFQKELSSILDYIEQLKKVDISNIEPTSHPFSIKNVVRPDEAESKRYNLLESAPKTKDGYIKVKQILK